MRPRTRPALSSVPDRDDQVPRKARYEAAHPGAEFAWPGGWAQAHLPYRGMTVTVTRPTLKLLLDRLEELDEAPEGEGR